MPRNGSASDDGLDRRSVIKAIGVAGTGVAGIGSLTGTASATDAGKDMYVYPGPGGGGDGRGGPGGGGGSGGSGGGITINVNEIADNVSPGEACEMMVAGCATYTALAAADLVPGDELLLGAVCTAGGAGCVVYNAFKDEHGDQNAKVSRAKESAGNIEYNDYIMVPAAWGW